MSIPAVRQIRESLYLINWCETIFQASKETQVALNDQLSIVLKYDGFGTGTVNFHVSLDSTQCEKLFGEQTTAAAVEVANLIATDGYGTLNKMTISSKEDSWIWSTSWNKTVIQCSYCRPGGNCYNCATPSLRTTFAVELLLDLKPSADMSQGQQNVLNHLSHLLEDQTLSDIAFQVKKETIKAHSIIVAAGSPVFAAMLQQDFIEKQTKTVEIKDIKPEVFKQLLHYLYTGKAFLIEKEGMAHDLLVAADKYGVDTLKEECAAILARNLKIENAARTLIIAHLHSSSRLHEATLSFMSKHGKAICSRSDWMDLIKTYPELCFQATQLMV
jgi:hypothetical protein